MKAWTLAMAADVGKVISANPFVAAIVGTFLYIFGLLYGRGPVIQAGMTVLCFLVVIDWITGTSAAKKDNIDTSSYGIEGMRRTVVLMMVPAAAHFLDLFLLTQGFATFFTIAALARNILRSIVANLHRTGWSRWIPTELLETLVDWVSSEIEHKEARAQRRRDELRQTNRNEEE